MADGDDGSAGNPPSEPAGRDDDAPVAWADLPPSAQAAAVAVAARVLGALPDDAVPHSLARIARFVPAKRARSGAAPIARALGNDPGFCALIGQYLPAGFGATGADPAAAAARAYLLRLPGSSEILDAVAHSDEVTLLRARVAELVATVDDLTDRLARAQRHPPGGMPPASADGAPAAPDGDAAAQEIAKLRRRLRDQGTRLKQAETQAAQDVARAVAERDDAVAQLDRERANAEAWRAKSEQEAHQARAARQALDRARDEFGRDRADGDRRLELLLDTVVDAAAGLRREWRLATAGSDPADVVARALPAPGPRPERRVDRARLLQWLALPGAHLIVDGYNVTKSGYPELTLADQRDRLIRSLGALAARTGVEVTVVFDGADVVAAPTSTREVRVVFSPAGVIADDVIRKMAAAEPAGRVVVVVTADREVVDGVRRSGARTAPSAVLLDVLT